MRKKFHPNVAVGIGNSKDSAVFNDHHFAGLSPDVQRKIADMGLQRVAGNAFVCSADHSFWAVSKDGKINRLVKSEVDEGDTLKAAPADSPQKFLDEILSDLSWD